VDRSVEHYFSAGLTSSSLKTYQVGQKQYLSFCEEAQTPPLPVSETILCHFAAALASKNIAHSTIKVYLSATRQLQIEKGLPDPKMQNMAKLSQVLRGVRATQAGKSTTVRLPITPQILERIKEAWERTGLNDN